LPALLEVLAPRFSLAMIFPSAPKEGCPPVGDRGDGGVLREKSHLSGRDLRQRTPATAGTLSAKLIVDDQDPSRSPTDADVAPLPLSMEM